MYFHVIMFPNEHATQFKFTLKKTKQTKNNEILRFLYKNRMKIDVTFVKWGGGGCL